MTTDSRIKDLTEICVAWNKRELDSKQAMGKVWKLFEKDNLALWNKQIKEGKGGEAEK